MLTQPCVKKSPYELLGAGKEKKLNEIMTTK